MRLHPGIAFQSLIPGTTRPLGKELSLGAEARPRGNQWSWRQAPGARPLCFFPTLGPWASDLPSKPPFSHPQNGLSCELDEINLQKELSEHTVRVPKPLSNLYAPFITMKRNFEATLTISPALQ